ncbi:MORN repeat-containing protein [Proteiniborus ethanoligenes]|uniref:MORN repeat-containing protein n=1 Tax=Proteiniborus ethanoligenes TaxID=415015 RepID=A0A1H3SHI6_9FIRM|nr:hypothetical protein [Proteiniborus ethanoligenes]SDZ37394.1 MORN repeat-containing protein [Proteiniborus ethanoligenes]
MDPTTFKILYENLCLRVSQEKLAIKYGCDPRFKTQQKISECVIENGFGTGAKGFQAAYYRTHLQGLSREEFAELLQDYGGNRSKKIDDFIAHIDRKKASRQNTIARPDYLESNAQQGFRNISNNSNNYNQVYNYNKVDKRSDSSIGSLFISIVALAFLFLILKAGFSYIAKPFSGLSSIFNKDINVAPISTSNGTYIGEVDSKNRANGYGVEYVDKDNLYLGKFKKNEKSGEGIEIVGENYFAMGNYKKDKLDGLGVINQSGTLYIGDMKKGEMDGYIVEISPGYDSIAISRYKKGKEKESILSIDMVSGQVSYLGSKKPYGLTNLNNRYYLETDKKTAVKSIEIREGYIFVGSMKRGNYKGLGIKVFDDTISYGDWKGNDVKSSVNLQDGNVFFGDYKNSLKNGKGMDYILVEPPDTEVILKGDIYIGYFKNSMRHGNGKFIFNDGLIIDM